MEVLEAVVAVAVGVEVGAVMMAEIFVSSAATKCPEGPAGRCMG